MIGYDASPKDRKRYAHCQGMEDQAYDYSYPLIDWGWDRDACKEFIRDRMGLPVPPKSACYFCPATQPSELHEHRKIYLRYIVIMEARAKPRLDGHIPQEEHDRRYERAVKKWQEDCVAWEIQCSRLRPGSKRPPKPKEPRRGSQATGVLGLWRRGRKGTRGGLAMPGMMTDYIRQHNLLPAEEIDELIARAPVELLNRQQSFANGEEIPAWHDFIEAFSPEDAADELLPVLRECGGTCHCF
jgi:hypothetical protein